MKTLSLRFLMAATVACLMFGFTSKSFAGPVPGDLLIQAYTTLEKADHDYKGHRADAMREIEAAGKLLGIRVRGDGKGHEKQGVSDEQLRVAQGLLEQARGGLQGKALAHVNKAIQQISIALKIK
jgi:hypothetical protein